MTIVHLNRKFYPVIHCIAKRGCVDHASKNVKIAIENDADGVFLIGHSINCVALHDIYEEVRKKFPNIWMGINFLDISFNMDWVRLSRMSNCSTKLNGLWIDNMPDEKIYVSEGTQVFAGVAFKYINPRLEGKDLAIACSKACEIVDVVTTSGDKTGYAPNISKIKSIREYIGANVPLALASGVNENNICSFIDYIDIFLVASSILNINPEDGEEYFVPEKVKKLAKLIHS